MDIVNTHDSKICQYYDEDNFIRLNRSGKNHLNIFSMNIRSLPKHSGQLLHFVNSLKVQFHVIVITEIGSTNIDLVTNLFPNYSFHYVLPVSNRCGGVGIYLSESARHNENCSLEKDL